MKRGNLMQQSIKITVKRDESIYLESGLNFILKGGIFGQIPYRI
jgi:hypothetical protein